MLSLYHRLGGRPAVEAAIRVFYDRVLADPLLAPFFNRVDTLRLAMHQARFMTHAFGGDGPTPWRSLADAHAHLVRDAGLSDIHFDRVAAHLAATFELMNVPANLANEALQIVAGTREEVLGRAGDSARRQLP